MHTFMRSMPFKRHCLTSTLTWISSVPKWQDLLQALLRVPCRCKEPFAMARRQSSGLSSRPYHCHHEHRHPSTAIHSMHSLSCFHNSHLHLSKPEEPGSSRSPVSRWRHEGEHICIRPADPKASQNTINHRNGQCNVCGPSLLPGLTQFVGSSWCTRLDTAIVELGEGKSGICFPNWSTCSSTFVSSLYTRRFWSSFGPWKQLFTYSEVCRWHSQARRAAAHQARPSRVPFTGMSPRLLAFSGPIARVSVL